LPSASDGAATEIVTVGVVPPLMKNFRHGVHGRDRGWRDTMVLITSGSC
jgi:hypothetical protein